VASTVYNQILVFQKQRSLNQMCRTSGWGIHALSMNIPESRYSSRSMEVSTKKGQCTSSTRCLGCVVFSFLVAVIMEFT